MEKNYCAVHNINKCFQYTILKKIIKPVHCTVVYLNEMKLFCSGIHTNEILSVLQLETRNIPFIQNECIELFKHVMH